jgi:hypothetical protein
MFSQNDLRWKWIRLGSSQHTIGSAGCLLCCIAGALEFTDNPMDPARLNRWLNLHGGYVRECDIVFNAVEALGLRLVVVQNWEDVKADVVSMRQYIDDGYAVAIKVDKHPSSSSFQQHWLLAHTVLGHDVLVYDPWTYHRSHPPQSLLAYYALPAWSLARAVYGMAVWDHPKREEARGA